MIFVDETREVRFVPTEARSLSDTDIRKRLVTCFVFMLIMAYGGVMAGEFVGQLPSGVIAKYLNLGFDETKIQDCREAIEAIPEQERATTELSKGLSKNPVDECRLFRPEDTKPVTVGDLRRPDEFGAILQEFKDLEAQVKVIMSKVGMILGGLVGFFIGLLIGVTIVERLFPEQTSDKG